jgi:hypothetical protein
MIPLDDLLRPTWLFGKTVHEGCDRAGYYEQGDFAHEYGSPKCLVKIGCWGPVVNCNVTKRGWMNGIGGCPPGTLYVIEADPAADRRGGPGPAEAFEAPSIDAHGLDPAMVLSLASALDIRLPLILVVGCEPGPADPAGDPAEGLSPCVRAAVEEAIPLVESLVIDLLDLHRSPEVLYDWIVERSGA